MRDPFPDDGGGVGEDEAEDDVDEVDLESGGTVAPPGGVGEAEEEEVEVDLESGGTVAPPGGVGEGEDDSEDEDDDSDSSSQSQFGIGAADTMTRNIAKMMMTVESRIIPIEQEMGRSEANDVIFVLVRIQELCRNSIVGLYSGQHWGCREWKVHHFYRGRCRRRIWVSQCPNWDHRTRIDAGDWGRFRASDTARRGFVKTLKIRFDDLTDLLRTSEIE